ncbi:hypothetical protein H2200_007707 [Cladophialophora chaetospira]|uniref:Uncharacterized protein n=1 Tax=Cladophialophora chaetospira TaxID=386627 RepID=A0AA38X6C0_9EURO|nr:hypothetical protein H2200_007707 [Cladophialophora chaetospira]
MDNLLSTADVPPQFLKAAMLLGHIPWRSLPSDPRISYALYVPPTQYNPSLTSTSPSSEKLPLLVFIHGTRRSISAIDGDDDLVPFADSLPCAILAPLFPIGLDGPNDLDSYKLLRSRGVRSDLALLHMLDEVARRWPGISTERIFLMGFSGGGQFAQRFLYLYPETIAAVSIGAPGRVTHLDEQRKWPGGIADVEALFGRQVDREGIQKVKIQLVVGDQDNVLHGGEKFWEWVREMKAKAPGKDGSLEGKAADEGGLEGMRQGRVDTIRELQAKWRQEGIDAHLDVVEGMGHDSKPARGVVLEFLKSAMLDRAGQ